MKNALLVTACLFIVNANAQTQSINFETGDLNSVFAKAKQENKLIFIDAYTSWCGPCKAMAKNVFTKDSVADYFNANFVNYKMDMEKGEGPDFAKKYEVSCFPSLLILDANGSLVHRAAGYFESAQFIAFGSAGQTPEKTFVAKKNEYEKTGINEGNVLAYHELLSSVCFDSSPLVVKYLSSVKDEDLIKPANWKLIKQVSNDYRSREMQYLLKNVSFFEQQFGKKEIERKIIYLGEDYFWKITRSDTFNRAAFEKARAEFMTMKWPYSERILFNADLTAAYRTNKDDYFAMASARFQSYNNDNASALNNTAWKFYEECDNIEYLKAAVNMAKRSCELELDYAALDTYAALLFKTGNYKEADLVVQKAIAIAVKAQLKPEQYKETTELHNKIKEKL
jgi:thioredoxin-related protein